eukprot:TRINITY_DN6089_c0_g1_i3.p1 TRINITY_DN6089_c0_g1~~TRINITY_DN6089_c0_g1_i3.p1  ORF type:complete len:294 (+),score=-8.95 TRINITY_DN6089_c0_g1_i3:62-943(+)
MCIRDRFVALFRGMRLENIERVDLGLDYYFGNIKADLLGLPLIRKLALMSCNGVSLIFLRQNGTSSFCSGSDLGVLPDAFLNLYFGRKSENMMTFLSNLDLQAEAREKLREALELKLEKEKLPHQSDFLDAIWKQDPQKSKPRLNPMLNKQKKSMGVRKASITTYRWPNIVLFCCIYFAVCYITYQLWTFFEDEEFNSWPTEVVTILQISSFFFVIILAGSFNVDKNVGSESIAIIDTISDGVVLYQLLNNNHRSWFTLSVISLLAPYIALYAPLASRIYEPGHNKEPRKCRP